MKVVVCLKHVPDPREPRRFEPAGHTLLRDSAEGMPNPLDDHALEAVLRWRDEGLEVDCWALTMGPASARDTLKRALAKGADHAVWIQDPALAGSDLLATSRAIARAVERIGEVALVLMGDRSLDAGCGVLAPMVAERLGWPSLSGTTSLEAGSDAVTVEVAGPTGPERWQATLPTVVAIAGLSGEPRLPSFTGIMGTSKKELVGWSLAELALAPEAVGAEGSGTRVLAVHPARPAAQEAQP